MSTTNLKKEPLLKKLRRMPSEIVYYFAGLYFTYFKKVYRNLGVAINVPNKLTSIRFRGRFIFNNYEKEEAKFLKEYLRPNASVLELGGCLGYVSCLTNKLLNNPDQHVVVEANPALIKWISKNRDKNQCNFKVENVVVSNQKQNTFYIHPIIHCSSLNASKNVNKVDIEGVFIKDLEEKHQVNFDTLVMDIEGGELMLLRNHKEELKNFRQIFLELHTFGGVLSKEEGLECEAILAEIGLKKTLEDGCFQIWERA